jgi:hypothetical protein
MSMTPEKKKKLDQLWKKVISLRNKAWHAELEYKKLEKRCWDQYSFIFERYVDKGKELLATPERPYPWPEYQFEKDTMYALSIPDLHNRWRQERNFGKIDENSIKLMEKPKRKKVEKV